MGISNFFISSVGRNAVSHGSVLTETFQPHESCKHVHAVSLLEFCVLSFAECLFKQMHPAPRFLDYSHSFLTDLRPPGLWFVIRGSSFLKRFHPVVNWMPVWCILPVMRSESPSHSCYGLQICKLWHIVNRFLCCHPFRLPHSLLIWKEINFHELKTDNSNALKKLRIKFLYAICSVLLWYVQPKLLKCKVTQWLYVHTVLCES